MMHKLTHMIAKVNIAILLILQSGSAFAMPGKWYCNSPLDIFGDDIHSPFAFELRLHPEGQFDAIGTQDFGSLRADFTWAGRWTDLDGQLAMIGTKTYGNDAQPQSEMRAFTEVSRDDILILTTVETAPWEDTLRCLRTLLE